MAGKRTENVEPNSPVELSAPEFREDDDRSAQERWLDQQWRDAASNRLGEQHPQSLNQDSEYMKGS